MPSHDRLSLNASTTVMTPGTPFTVDVISSSGDVFLLNGILLMGTANGGNVVQTTITLNSGTAQPTAITERVPSAVTINPATLSSGETYELQVEYYNANVGTQDSQSASFPGLLVSTIETEVNFASMPSAASVIANTPVAFSPTFSSMPTSTLTSISTSPSPTAAPIPGGAGIATGAGDISASSSPSSSSGSSALGTGAKAGIAVGVVALVLVLVIAALVAWRAGRKRQSRGGALELVPNAEMMPYTHNRDTDRDLTAEKEMNIIGAPGYVPGFHHVDTGFSDASSTAAAAVASGGVFGHAHASPTESPPVAAGLRGNVGPVPQQQYMQPSAEPQYVQPSVEPLLPDSPYVSPVYEQPPIHSQHSSALLSAGQLGSQLASLHEPGMSDEELARLAEEERRLDEAIAEAERRRGSDA